MTPIRTQRGLFVLLALGAAFCAPGIAWGIGFVLGESKEELELEYDVAVTDHGTGRVTVVFTLINAGRLEPLDEVQLAIPAEEKNPDGGHWMDLVVSIDMHAADDGRKVGRVHILKSLAERGEIQLNTHTLDGQLDPLTRLHHVIPIAEYMNAAPAATGPASPADPQTPADAPPASERCP